MSYTKCCMKLSYIAGIPLVIVGIIVFIFEAKFVNKMVTKSVQLVPDNDIFKFWLKPPVPVYMTFHLYNLKNPIEYAKGGIKPVFEEIGPFVYRETRAKEDIKLNLNYTITYKERMLYTFVPELSKYHEDFSITTINIAAMTVLNFIQNSPNIEHELVNFAFQATKETLLVTKTAGELLWGYKDDFLAVLHRLVPTIVESDQVGFFIGQNNTIDGEYVIYTGVDDIQKIGWIERFNGQTSLNVWASPFANMINGTDGTLSNPFVDKLARSYAFQSNLCRSIYGVYNGTVKFLDDIDIWKIAANEYVMANPSINPENADFCTPLGNCVPSGFLNMTECMKLGNIHLPIILSSPHFLFADSTNLQKYEGIDPPTLDAHNTIVYLEPLTGIEFKANKRLQFNVNCVNDSKIKIAQNMTPIFFPIFWLDENFEADKSTADNFYRQLKLPILIINIAKFIVIILGGLLVVIALTLTIRLKNQAIKATDRVNEDSGTNWISSETTPLLNEN